MKKPEEVRAKAPEGCGRMISMASGGCCCRAAALAAYGGKDAGAGPPGTEPFSLGCGHPLALDGVAPGQTVVELGSGAGLDLMIAAERVGPRGRVIGVDMTGEMIGKARAKAAAAGLGNVEVRKGIVEDLPVESGSADWVVSNCVINLSPEKGKVFSEIFRVLRPGGAMLGSDIVVKDLPGWVRNNEILYKGCVAGAVGEEEYLGGLRAAGLVEVKVIDRHVYDAAQLKAFLLLEVTGSLAGNPCSCEDYLTGRLLGRTGEILTGRIWSALFSARKP